VRVKLRSAATLTQIQQGEVRYDVTLRYEMQYRDARSDIRLRVPHQLEPKCDLITWLTRHSESNMVHLRHEPEGFGSPCCAAGYFASATSSHWADKRPSRGESSSSGSIAFFLCRARRLSGRGK
jgi:hypothetical protein